MSTNINIEDALEKARAKRDLAKRLAGLPIRDQRDVLVDLLAALEESPEPVATKKQASAADGTQTQIPINGIGDDDEKGQRGRREQLIEALRAKPKSPIKQLTMAVYGDATKSHVSSVRANLTALGKQGRVRNIGFGVWEAAK